MCKYLEGYIWAVLYVLLLIDNPVLLLLADQYWCGVDICNPMKYCDSWSRDSWRCEWCVNKLSYCFTEHHIANCTKFCREQPCPPLGMLYNGVHNATGVSLSFGTTIESKCNDGFILFGSTVTTCLEFQHWSSDLPTCKEKGCNIPKQILNGLIAVADGIDQFTPGTTIMYNCLTGYTLQGNANRTCLADSTWSNATPVCGPELSSLDEKLLWQAITGILAVLFVASLVWIVFGDRIKRMLNIVKKCNDNKRNGKYDKVNTQDGKDGEDLENPPTDHTDLKLNLENQDEKAKQMEAPQFYDEKLQAFVAHEKDKTQAALHVPPREGITVLPADITYDHSNGHIGGLINGHVNGNVTVYANGHTASHKEDKKSDGCENRPIIDEHKTDPCVLNPSSSAGQMRNDRDKDIPNVNCSEVDVVTKHVFPVHIHINNTNSNNNSNINNVSNGAMAGEKTKEIVKVNEIELSKAVQESPLNHKGHGKHIPATRDEGGKLTQESASGATNDDCNLGVKERAIESNNEILMNELKKVDEETTEDGAPVVEDRNGISSFIGIGDHTLDRNLLV